MEKFWAKTQFKRSHKFKITNVGKLKFSKSKVLTKLMQSSKGMLGNRLVSSEKNYKGILMYVEFDNIFRKFHTVLNSKRFVEL